jgi:hypothetical protein
MSTLKVNYEVHANRWHIAKALEELMQRDILSFDTETAGVYTKAERKEATAYLKQENLPVTSKGLALQVEANCGLSFPSLVTVTHFVFGINDHKSVIIVCDNPQLELFIWRWIAAYTGKLIIHNALFDLKIMYHRIKKYPQNYEDSQLLAKCLTNNVEVYKARVGLKDLMGTYYDPMWVLVDEYEPEDLKNPKFIMYAAIDGAATMKLWYDIQDHLREETDAGQEN